MKNIFTCLIISSCMLLAACKKDNNNNNTKTSADGKVYKVTFSVNNFTSQKLPLQLNSAKPRSLATAVKYDTLMTPVLCYIVYDSNGNEVHRINQTVTDANFGQINDQLTAGTYTVVFIGGENMLDLPTGADKMTVTSTTKLSTDYVSYTYPLNFSEIFFKKMTLTVTAGNTISQSVDLPRIVGQLAINIKDAIPSNLYRIMVDIEETPVRFELATGQPSYDYNTEGTGIYYSYPTGVNANQLNHFTPGQTNYTTYNYFLAGGFQVIITCTDINGFILAKKTVNASVSANKQTILSGNLFGGTATGGIKAQADTTWSATTLNYSF